MQQYKDEYSAPYQMPFPTVMIWGIALPVKALSDIDIRYLNSIANIERPPVEWIWQEMDRAWDELGLDNRLSLQKQKIGSFYSHPIWLVNGLFSAVDPSSAAHRDSIAAFVSRCNAKRVADYGGGFGELAIKLSKVAPESLVDIIEPYPSKLGLSRVEGKLNIRFIDSFDGQYDCVIAQDVLEHVERPLILAKDMVLATKLNGYLIFANCFFPVEKCHLPSTFYLRHTFIWVLRYLGLRFEGRVIKGASHALVFKRIGNINYYMLRVASLVAMIIGPVLNAAGTLRSAIYSHFRKTLS